MLIPSNNQSRNYCSYAIYTWMFADDSPYTKHKFRIDIPTIEKTRILLKLKYFVEGHIRIGFLNLTLIICIGHRVSLQVVQNVVTTKCGPSGFHFSSWEQRGVIDKRKVETTAGQNIFNRVLDLTGSLTQAQPPEKARASETSALCTLSSGIFKRQKSHWTPIKAGSLKLFCSDNKTIL